MISYLLIFCFVVCFSKLWYDLDNPRTFSHIKDFILFVICIFCVCTVLYLNSKGE